jgi:hypothetical protein
MNNKKSYLGDAVGTGGIRVVRNVILMIAIAASVIGSAVLIKIRVIDLLLQ